MILSIALYKRIILSCLLVLAMNTCTLFPGYQKDGKGIYFELLEISDQGKRAEEGDLLTLNLLYANAEDSVFFHAVRKFRLSGTNIPDSFNRLLTRFSEGDSVSVKIRTGQYFNKTLATHVPDFLSENKYMNIRFRILEVQSSVEFEEEKSAFLKWLKEANSSEEILMKEYLSRDPGKWESTASGIFIRVLKDGPGPFVKKGQSVNIHYEGKFMNGIMLESTRERGESLDFVYGQEMMVIKAIEEVIGLMKEGSTVRIVIPSHLAFGESGSANGLVPPYTPLVYEIELLSDRR